MSIVRYLVITDLQYNSQNAEVPMWPKQPGPTVVSLSSNDVSHIYLHNSNRVPQCQWYRSQGRLHQDKVRGFLQSKRPRKVSRMTNSIQAQFSLNSVSIQALFSLNSVSIQIPSLGSLSFLLTKSAVIQGQAPKWDHSEAELAELWIMCKKDLEMQGPTLPRSLVHDCLGGRLVSQRGKCPRSTWRSMGWSIVRYSHNVIDGQWVLCSSTDR